MKLHKFTLGAIAGATSLLIAIPIIAQISSAQSSAPGNTRPVPTAACVQAMAAKEDLMLSTYDADSAARKTALQAYDNALKAAAAITDDTQRQAALKLAEQNLATAMKNAMQTQSAAMQTAMQNIQTACGNAGGRGGFGMGMPGGPMMMGGGKGGKPHGFGGPMHGRGGWNKGSTQNSSSSTASTL